PIVTIIAYVFLIAEMGKVPLILTGGFCLAALVWYLCYVQRKIDRQSAIVYMVKNIVSRNIQRTGLEEELKQIALQRDQIEPDRFDSLVKDCDILDINKKIDACELFELASEALSGRLKMKPADIYELFIEREKESNTIVKPGLAIPHVIVEGAHVFQVLLVRCEKGIVFSDLQEPVRTAFFLIGSADERNYHLRALMTVAHIVSEEGFEERWFSAKNIEQLRDIVLLSERRRG
ncbi:MAG: PTS sugar transporter subunit IIA, partial [Planctomycetes bacterium]|nr:PTS sugar transporter subunit IIA [Planctomycetota bacterium]